MLIDNKNVIRVIERCPNPMLNGAEILDTVDNAMEKILEEEYKDYPLPAISRAF